MNKRILELAIAAAPANSSIPHSEWNIPKEFIEKFAELIVAECMIVVSKKCASPTAYNALVEHFGVEE